ncbi:MAG: hypothetical protein JJV92_06445 [Desulfosarcina sp.]|nr:hypothetical protein [Desulfobacterales bacterium]
MEYIKKSDEELKLVWESTEKCRCTPNLPKIVYGFYPFWIKNAAIELDFSILSRIGYFSIAPDYGGNIKKQDLLHLRDSEFIKKAHQYGTDIDIVLSLYDRVSESKDQGKFVLEREHIVQKLIDRVVEVLGQSGADGVTVVVVPDKIDEQKQQRLANFIYSLGTSLKKADNRYKLSILLFAEKKGGNASVIKELADVKEKIDFVLFEMSWHGKDERPTCNLYEQRLHKRIRGLMENGIKPEKIIPIVPVYGFKRDELYAATKMVYISEIEKLLYDPAQNVQIKNDFICLKKDKTITYYDNLTDLDGTFDLIKKNDTGGIAIWALGLEEDQSGLWKMLEKNFSPDDQDISYVRRFIKDTPVATPCIWICACRGPSRIAIFYIIPAVIVIFNFAAWFFCQARTNCDKWWWVIPAGFIAWIILFYSYIVCVHGWWNKIRDELGIVLVVTIIGILLVCAYKIYGERIRQRLP